jgi:hypothetical protein
MFGFHIFEISKNFTDQGKETVANLYNQFFGIDIFYPFNKPSLISNGCSFKI